jgi:DNA invertase Pin-like site-specific DNA recombinase
MTTDGVRAAIYMRVSTTDGQTTENQRLALARVAAHRRWEIVQTYEDAGISGAKGRDQRPAFNQMLKDAVRGRFHVLMVWSIDRLGRSDLHVASAMAEMDAAGVALYSDQQAIDSTSPFGTAMMQMACVFRELEREMIRARVRAGLSRVREQGLKKLGRPRVGKKVEDIIRRQLGAGHGILKVAKMVGCGSGTVQRVKREMAATMVEAA